MTGPATRLRRPRAGGLPRRHRARPAVLAALTVLGLGLAPLLAGMAGTAGIAAAAATDKVPFAVDVAVTAVSPQVLHPGQDLVLHATLRNTGDTPVAEPRAVVRISRFRLSTRAALSTWAGAEPSEPAGSASGDPVALGAPLAPGASADVTVTVPAADVRLSSSPDAWGPRGLALEVTDGGRRVGVARTFALWMPGDEVARSRLSVLVPVVGPPADPFAEGPSAALEELTGPGGRLDAVLTATGGHDTVSWAVDPALVVATEQGGPQAQAWATHLAAARTGRDVFALPYLDPDLAALAHADAAELAQAAVNLAASGDGAAAVLGPQPRTDVAWPADDVPDLDTVTLAARTGATAVVTGPGALEPRVRYTPTALERVPTSAGEVTALVPDRTLSDLLTDPARVARRDAGPEAADVATPTAAVASQRVLAETAVIARERDGDVRHLLATVPRDWDPDAATAGAELDALESAPWVTLAPLSGLLGAKAPDVDREPLPATRTASAELAPALVTALQQSRTATAELATAVADPAALLAGLDQELLAPTSVAWREDPPGRAGVVAAVLKDGADRRAGLQVQPPRSVVNLIAESGPIPLTVVNDLDQDVTVTVRLRSRNACLIPEDQPTVTVPAGAELAVRIPVRAVANCDVRVEAGLLSGTGAAVAEPAMFTVRVRADWENVGTAVIAGLLGVGLVIGIVRTVHRGQTARRGAKVLAGAPIDDAGAHDADARDDGATDGEAATGPDGDGPTRPDGDGSPTTGHDDAGRGAPADARATGEDEA